MLGLCHFCLDFSEFGYVTEFFYVTDFFYVSKKLRKSLGLRKMSLLVFFFQKNKAKAMESQQIFYVFLKKQRFSKSQTFSMFLDGLAYDVTFSVILSTV